MMPSPALKLWFTFSERKKRQLLLQMAFDICLSMMAAGNASVGDVGAVTRVK